jgi:hypothetical protein
MADAGREAVPVPLLEGESWAKFPRQRRFQFMSQGEDSTPLHRMPPAGHPAADASTDWDFRPENYYHVTANLPGILRDGRFLSRRELRNRDPSAVIGLGGGHDDRGRNRLSVTYSLDRARMIRDAIVSHARAATGGMRGSEALGIVQNAWLAADAIDDTQDDEGGLSRWEEFLSRSLRIGPSQVMRMEDRQLLEAADKILQTPREVWEFLSTGEDEANLHYQPSLSADLPAAGVTIPWEAVSRIDPRNVAILQVAIRKGTDLEWIPEELEMRVDPAQALPVRILRA